MGVYSKLLFITFHAGPAWGLKRHSRNNFCVFNPVKLKLCNITDFSIANNRMIFVFDFNGFWRENDVLQRTSKFYFHLMTDLLRDFKRICWDEFKYEKIIEKPLSVQKIRQSEFWISRHFVTIFRTLANFKMQYLLNH